MSDENTPPDIPEVPTDAAESKKHKKFNARKKKPASEKKAKKKKKPKGPIRFGAVIPLTLIIGGIVAFNIYFLDSTIKKAIEWGGTEANGAEVNVASVKSSFKDLNISVNGIQFTDKKNPDYNLFEIGSLKFHMLWDAVLRGKIVIDLAQLADIKVATKRARRGYVPPPPKKGTAVKDKVLATAQKEFDGNVFGDIAAVAGGASAQDTGDAIKEGLESEKKFKELENKINNQKAKLEKSFKDLPSQKELQGLEKRLRNIRWKDLGNLAKAPKVLKEADTLKKDIDKAIKKYKKAEKELQRSDKLLKNAYKEAEAAVEEDIAAVGKRMKIPTLNPEGIARGLFGNEIFAKVDELKGYYAKIEKYLPPKKEGKSDKEKIAEKVAAKRGEGKNYSFGTPKTYPLFWMKLAKINSQNEQGTVAGQIKDVTNNQTQLGRLTTINIKADFPPQEIRGIEAKATIDHRDEPSAMIEGRVASMPVENKAISKSKDVTFVLAKASVESKLKAKVTPKKADIRINNNFTKIDYETKAKSKEVDEVLREVARRTQLLTLDAKATGKWSALGFDIKSNLAQKIQEAVRGLVEAKIKAIQEKIRADVQREINKQKAQIDKQIAAVRNQFQGELNKANSEINKVKNQLNSEKKKAEKQAKKAKKKAEDDIKKKLKKNLLKGIKL